MVKIDDVGLVDADKFLGKNIQGLFHGEQGQDLFIWGDKGEVISCSPDVEDFACFEFVIVCAALKDFLFALATNPSQFSSIPTR